MLKKINICDYYVALWVLYELKDVLYTHGIINRLIAIMMVVWCSIISIKVLLNKNKSPLLNALFCLIGMFSIYGIIPILQDKTFIINGEQNVSYSYLIQFFNSLLPIILFYYYTQKGTLNSRKIIIYALIFLVVYIVHFFHQKYISYTVLNREESTNNIGYSFVGLIPFLYFFRKKTFWQYLLGGLIGIFILISMKRGAILIGGLSLIIFLYSNLKNSKGKQKVIISIFSILIILGGIYYISYMLSSSDYFIKRIEATADGDSSGRDIIYNTIWRAIYNETNVLYILFGRGANATLDIAGIHAHQDWLETLACTGIFGTFILFIFFLVLIKTGYNQKKRFSPAMYFSFIITMFIVLCKTFFSMSIQDLQLNQTLLLGYFAYWSTRPKEELVKNDI